MHLPPRQSRWRFGAWLTWLRPAGAEKAPAVQGGRPSTCAAAEPGPFEQRMTERKRIWTEINWKSTRNQFENNWKAIENQWNSMHFNALPMNWSSMGRSCKGPLSSLGAKPQSSTETSWRPLAERSTKKSDDSTPLVTSKSQAVRRLDLWSKLS